MRITGPASRPHAPLTARNHRGRLIRTSATCLALAVAALVVAGPAVAHTTGPALAVASSIDEVLDNMRNWLVGILAALATVCLTIGGARYVIGAAEPGEVEKAKFAFRAACVGFGLAMLAPVIVAVLKSFVGA